MPDRGRATSAAGLPDTAHDRTPRVDEASLWEQVRRLGTTDPHPADPDPPRPSASPRPASTDD